MVHKENLFDGDLIAGIITALIVMILFSIYAIISPKPASARKQVFRPYPAISPKDIPDAPLGNQKCFSESIPCPGPSPTPSPSHQHLSSWAIRYNPSAAPVAIPPVAAAPAWWYAVTAARSRLPRPTTVAATASVTVAPRIYP